MKDPSYPLQAAIVAALTGDGVLADLVGSRVYDIPPVPPVFPYITLGDDHVANDSSDCVDSAEVTVTIHAWSRNTTWQECKLIASRVAEVLDEALSLDPDDHYLIDINHETTRYLRDPDGVTRHAVMTFQAITEAS